MTVQAFTFNPFATNLYVVSDGGEAIVVDAASHRADEHAAVAAYVAAQGLVVRHLLLTHAHLDHVYGCRGLADALTPHAAPGAALAWRLHPSDAPLAAAVPMQAQLFGVPLPDALPSFGAPLKDDEELAFGNAAVVVRPAPGHAPGHVVFVGQGAAAGHVFAGDVLFRGSIGRTDLPLGDLPTLMRSLETELLPLDDATVVWPGHGDETTVGHERRTNPYLI